MTFLGMERLELVVLFPPLCIQSIPCKVEAVEGIDAVLRPAVIQVRLISQPTNPFSELGIGTISLRHSTVTFLGMERLELVVIFPPMFIPHPPRKVEAVEGINTVLLFGPATSLNVNPTGKLGIGTISLRHSTVTHLGMECLELVVLFPPLCIRYIPRKVQAVEGINLVLLFGL